jgi:hypothetical protein
MSFLKTFFGFGSNTNEDIDADTDTNADVDSDTIEDTDTNVDTEDTNTNEDSDAYEDDPFDPNINTGLIAGENGSLEYSPDVISDKLLVMFFKMLRDTSESEVEKLYNDNIEFIKNNSIENRVILVTNLFILCFLTRSCRGGKGEKTLFYKMFELLVAHFPNSINMTLHLLPHYGSWKDVFVLIKRGNISGTMIDNLLKLVINQLKKDDETDHPSLLAKWMPRESRALYEEVNETLHKHGLQKISYLIVSNYYGKPVGKREVQKKYRQLITGITKKLNIIETQMCNGKWSEINFESIPSIALSKYRHAFDLTDQAKCVKKRLSPTEDRLLCKEKYIDFLVNGKVNGSQIAINKLVESVTNIVPHTNVSLSSLQANGPYNLLLAHRQFNSHVDYIKEQLEVAKNEAKQNTNNNFTFSPCDCEVMIDVSGSMIGEPINAAIGIGMVIMALQKQENPECITSFITFDTEPELVDITKCTSFPETVALIANAAWGGSTDFEKAFDLMLNKSGENISNAKKTLVVLSDMQFNQAISNDPWDTMYNNICKKWKNWYNVEDDQLPTIVFWNLRGSTVGHPVKSDTRGVTEISGFSANLFKMILFGQELKETNPEVEPNPSQILARTLAAKEYDLVKEALGWNNNNLCNNTLKEECELL